MSLFAAAFSPSQHAYRSALEALRAMRDEPVQYAFSYDVARWLASRCKGEVTIDWDELEDSSGLDELLRQILQPAEDEYFDSGWIDTKGWIELASSGRDGTDFDWLMAHLCKRRSVPFWRQLYDAADIPLRWDADGSRYAKSRNRLVTGRACARRGGMRRRPAYPKREILRPLARIRLVPRPQGRRLVDIAMASLATRYRETLHFNHANPDEVYVADVGLGVSVVVFGLLPESRYPLECTLGYLILANGVPIGYGGSSALFKQVNTGLNIFDEFRRSEAAYLWTQVMRVYRQLVGCTRFVANAYQFGADNPEALRSGAFWFYYRLGYRPVDADVAALARREAQRLRKAPSRRSDVPMLRDLASSDMHLTLPGARARDYFDEHWFDTCSRLATRIIGAAGGATRSEAAGIVASRVARDIGLRATRHEPLVGSPPFRAIAPLIAAASPSAWSTGDKRRLRRLLRAKAGAREVPYARLAADNDKLLFALQKACRRADRE